MLDLQTSMLEMFRMYFAPKGFRFIPINDPRAFVKRFGADRPDILIMDIALGEVRGENIIKVLRKNGIPIPIFVVSAKLDKKTILDLKNYGVNECFVKPVSLEKIEERIGAVLSGRGQSPATGNRPKRWPPMTALIITDNVSIKEKPDTLIPAPVIQKFLLRVISKGSFQEAVKVLKNPENNIRIILVDAAKEAKIKAMTRLLKIIETKLKIQIFFFSDHYSASLKDMLMKAGFVNVFSRGGTPTKELVSRFENVLSESEDGTKKVSHRIQNIMKELHNIKSLPPLPDIYLKIEKLSRDPKATSRDFAKILELDPAITARLLRMSNSAYYSFKRKIKSVKDTVTLMGTREILSLVRLACITGNLKTKPDIEAVVKKVWEHSAGVAITARLLYKKTDLCAEKDLEEELFICGIIHDLGKIILWDFFPEIYMSFTLHPKVSSYPSIKEEEEFMGASHEDVGRTLAEYWKLPEPLSDAISYHHRPMNRPDSELVKMIHFSDIIADIAMKRIPEDREPEFSPELLEKTGRTAADFIKLAKELEPEITGNIHAVTKMITG